jgi:hypothetical protein
MMDDLIPSASLISEKLRCYLVSHNHNFVMKNFYINSWECDVFSATYSGLTNEYEIKRTLHDYKNDFSKKCGELKKHQLIQDGQRTNKFWYVVPEEWDFELPDYAGIFIYRHRGEEFGYLTKKKEAKILHRRKLKEDNKLLYNIATKCYYRIPKEYPITSTQRVL